MSSNVDNFSIIFLIPILTGCFVFLVISCILYGSYSARKRHRNELMEKARTLHTSIIANGGTYLDGKYYDSNMVVIPRMISIGEGMAITGMITYTSYKFK